MAKAKIQDLEQMWYKKGWGMKEEHPQMFKEYLDRIRDEL